MLALVAACLDSLNALNLRPVPTPRLPAVDKSSLTANNDWKDPAIPISLVELSNGLREQDVVRLDRTFSKEKKIKLSRVTSSLVKFAWRSASWPSKLLIIGSVSALVLSKMLSVWVPFLLQQCVDAAANANPRQAVIKACFAYCIARCSATLASEVRSLCYAQASQQATRAYATALYDKMLALDASFHAEHPTGLLSVAFSRGARGFQTLLFQLLFTVLPTLVELTLSASLLATKFGTSIGVATIVTFAAYAAFTAIVVDRKVKVKRRLVELDNAKSAYLVDALANYETVQLFENQRPESARFDHFLRRMLRALVASSRINSLLNLGQTLIFSAGLFYCLCASAGSNSLVAVNGLLLQLAQPMGYLGYTVSEIRQAVVDMTVTEEILETPVSRLANTTTTHLPNDTPPGIVFRDVSRDFQGGKKVALDGASFQVPAGKVTVLAGTSGSGKSSALRLLAKLDKPSSGRIYLTYDNRSLDLNDIDDAALRRVLGYVPQTPQLFDETIKWNVRYGYLNASDHQVDSVIRATKLDAIDMNIRLGERAVKISGGERQRVAIARALLRNPLLVCADEPTSAADSQTERALLDALVDGTRTVVVVAHRLNALAPIADNIVVFDNGTVVQAGTHHALLQNPDSKYAQLWRAATSDKRLDDGGRSIVDEDGVSGDEDKFRDESAPSRNGVSSAATH